MNEKRIHRAVSADGTEIAGRVAGQGPALVLVHGAIGHGDLAWEALLPHLTDRFTCYLPSIRGRGLSGDHPDHTPPRLVEDVTAFVDSIGEPVCLVGWSGSGPWCLGAAARSDSVTAVAAYEPIVPGTGQADMPRLGAALQNVGLAAADGRFVDAVRAFAAGICTDDEVAALEPTSFFDRWAGAVPALLNDLGQDNAYEGPRSIDPEALEQVSVPVLVLCGEQTLLSSLWRESAEHIARHVPDAHIRELPGAGHFAPVLEPKLLSKELSWLTFVWRSLRTA
ncbi:alpha/beta fold hydrolase [Phytohabitans aurantiacus]|jgi:pimeloyl-ACP methyl ester carboxylesterase|uniref:Alpha/beta hydrolase n=1 Tax=Phytohabitans aurantiacus TaxID=3016789 RepID=A0ABQ5R0Y8_9ACTN|nr:alpha/beta hydrolase [Phytohabitans aurantiacus]GLH99841.1 alpha/beta hydrolase [Phytohabitans aurantiacus]